MKNQHEDEEVEETQHKLRKINTIHNYKPELEIYKNLSVMSGIITELTEYSNLKENSEEESYAVFTLNFIQKMNDIIEKQQKQDSENIQIINKFMIIVDRSKSMIKDDKLINVKKSLIQLFENSNSSQQFSLISFGNSQKLHFKFEEVKNENKTRLLDEVKSIYATGQTDIVKVLQFAHSVIESDFVEEQKNNDQNRIIRYSTVLLTDGFDNIGHLALNKIREFFKNIKMRYSITCLGFGDEYDPHLLGGIASYSGGKYFYIRTNKDLQPVFDECIDLFENVVVENVEIEVENNGEVHRTDQFSNIYTFEVKQIESINANDQNLKRIYFKQIRNDDEKNILFKIKYKLTNDEQYKNNIKLLEQNLKEQQDCSIITSFSENQQQINTDSTNRDQFNDEQKNKLIISNIINENKKENENYINKSSESFSFLDLSNLSGDTNEYEKIEQSQTIQIKKDKTIENNKQIQAIENNQTEIVNNNKEQEDDKKKINSSEQNSKRNIIEDQNQDNLLTNQKEIDISSQSEQNKINNISNCNLDLQKYSDSINVTIGNLKVMFQYKGIVSQFYVPLTMKFTPKILSEIKQNENVLIQKLRNKYINIQRISNTYIQTGDKQKALDVLLDFQKVLDKYQLNNYPLFCELVKNNNSLIDQLEGYLDAQDEEEEQTYKREITIKQEMAIFRFKESTTTK